MDDLFNYCLESVASDYVSEGFKVTLKNAGKFVGKSIATVIDCLINTVRRMINVFANMIRKIAGKDLKRIEDKEIVRGFFSRASHLISFRNKMVKNVDPNGTPISGVSDKNIDETVKILQTVIVDIKNLKDNIYEHYTVKGGSNAVIDEMNEIISENDTFVQDVFRHLSKGIENSIKSGGII